MVQVYPEIIAVSPNFGFRVARGDDELYYTVNKFGRNSDIDTATDPEDIWDGGGLWVPPTNSI